MTRCPNCTEQLGFRKVYRSFLAGYEPITCPNCGVEYTHRLMNRFLAAGSIFALVMLYFVLGESVLVGVPLIWRIVGYLFVGFLVSLALVPLLRFERRATSGTAK